MAASFEPILLFCAGGHGSVVLDLALKSFGQNAVLGFVDEGKQSGSLFCGREVFSWEQFKAMGVRRGTVCLGDNWTREGMVKKILDFDPQFEFISLVHPSAVLGTGVKIGRGSVVMAGVVINPGTVVGDHCVVNTGAIMDHDGELAPFSSVGPGAVLGGKVTLGEGSIVGLGAKILHLRKIGAYALVGSGAVVLRDVPDQGVVWGVPAREIRRREKEEPYL